MTLNKIWKLIPPSPFAPRLAAEAGISPLKAQLLLNRGITDGPSAMSFLSPRLADLADPMLLKDMDRAVDHIIGAMKREEPVAVFGDYDADGITATALLVNLFSDLGFPVSSYIPNRLEEGYGLNRAAVTTLAGKGVRHIITVDCGISNQREIEFARKLGIRTVVTDHHQIPQHFAPVCPVINPHRPDSFFPFKELAGVGVALFLAIALRAALREAGWFRDRPEPDLRQYLDLAALGTVADMVPLTCMNRIIVLSGMEVMKNSRWPGLNALKEISGVDGSISSSDLAFKLAPRLNAPGRMGDSSTGLRALTTDRESVAAEAVDRLHRMNLLRQAAETEILEEIEEAVIPELDLKNRRTLVLAKEGWHKGVLGIVASRLLDRYYRPALVLTIQDGMATGSGRSVDGFNLHRAMTGLNTLFEKFGGHYHAAGCTLKATCIEDLAAGLERLARREMGKEDLIPSVKVDMELSLMDLTIDSIHQIQSLAPFGTGNPEPLFYAGSVEVIRSRVVGDRHLKLRVRQGGTVTEVIGFGFGDRHSIEGETINMIFSPEIDRWRGHAKIQLRLDDLEPAGLPSRLKRQLPHSPVPA